MTLSTNNPYAKPTFGKGVYINEATIIEVEDVSGTTPQPFIKQVDIGIRLTLDIGKTFSTKMLIAGDFKRNENQEVTSWGAAFIVQEAFAKLGYKGSLNPDNSIPDEALESLLDKKFLKLSYVSGVRENGKFYWTDWNNICSVEEGAEQLAKRFKASLAKGYPKNYRPELLDREPATEEAVVVTVDPTDERIF
ncbi:MAG: hypothetical protein WCW35_04920 [Bacteroidota bacterium]|jgi:hypothetical protein